MAIGPIIRRRREELNLSQGRLAQLAGLSQSYLSKIEKGSVRSPGVGRLSSLAAVLDIDLDRLLKEGGYEADGPRHRVAERAGPMVAAWTSWQTPAPCLRLHRGWVCEACRQWLERYRPGLSGRLTA